MRTIKPMAKILVARLGDGTPLLEGEDLSLKEIRAALADEYSGQAFDEQLVSVFVTDDAGASWRPFRFEFDTYPVVDGVVQL